MFSLKVASMRLDKFILFSAKFRSFFRPLLFVFCSIKTCTIFLNIWNRTSRSNIDGSRSWIIGFFASKDFRCRLSTVVWSFQFIVVPFVGVLSIFNWICKIFLCNSKASRKSSRCESSAETIFSRFWIGGFPNCDALLKHKFSALDLDHNWNLCFVYSLLAQYLYYF